MTKQEFELLYNLPLDIKVEKTKQRIREFYTQTGGCFVSFSGGKDSQVLAEICRDMGSPYNQIPLVFLNTGNERSSVKEIVDKYKAIVVSGDKTVDEVFEKYGYPLFNKEYANVICAYQNKRAWVYNILAWLEVHTPKEVETIHQFKKWYKGNEMMYVREDGKEKTFTHGVKLTAIFCLLRNINGMRFVADSPLPISDKCCYHLKKKLSKQYEKKSGLKPIVGVLAKDSQIRYIAFLKQGCNVFEKDAKSTPIGFWSKQNILEYIEENSLKIADCYKQKTVIKNGIKKTILTGVENTGCCKCGFGKGLEYALRLLSKKCFDYVMDNYEEYERLLNQLQQRGKKLSKKS